MRRCLAGLVLVVGLLALLFVFWAREEERRAVEAAPGEKSVRMVSGAEPAKEAREKVPADPVGAMADYLRADNYCGLRKKFPAWSEKSPGAPTPGQQYEALARAQSQEPNPCVLALYARSEEEAVRHAASSEAAACRFARALLFTGHWRVGKEERKPGAESVSRGIELLRDLAREEPGNGIYPYLELGALSRAGVPKSGWDEAFTRFLAADSFQSPWHLAQLEVHQLGTRSASAWLLRTDFSSLRGNPLFAEAQGSAVDLAMEERHRPAFERWAARMKSQRQDEDARGVRVPYANVFELQLIQSVVSMGQFSVNGEKSQDPYWQWKQWEKFIERRMRDPWLTQVKGEDLPCEEQLARARERLTELQREEEFQKAAAR